ncbi:alpha-L-rhamnosidase C-terminal domain-containing protein [Streptomyces iakyrus]|uniref:alpha-L-rhamnosidase C-terminal domain-containing protein n=1 Tax=Streptomyces iakyrus TaxID=68219 RepID=UPI0038141623
MTTVPEQWDMGNSKNHMVLLHVVSVRWLREKGRFRLDVELPPNTTPQVRYPQGDARPK